MLVVPDGITQIDGTDYPLASFSEATTYLKAQQRIDIDLETTGLDAYRRGDRLCGISMHAGDRSFYFPFRHALGVNLGRREFDLLKTELLCDASKTWTLWNAKFDLQMLIADGVPMLEDAEDVMLAAHLMNENEFNFKLKDLGRKYVDPNARDEQEDLAEALLAKNYGKGDMWRLPAWVVAPYAEQDVVLTGKLRAFYRDPLVRWELFELWEDCNRFMKVLTDMEIRGMLLDLPLTGDMIRRSGDEMANMEEAITRMIGYPVNPNSPKQVCALLDVTSSKLEVLETMMDRPGVREIVAHRRWTKMRGAYYRKFLDVSDGYGVLHPNMNQVGTETGRASCSNPNMQAMPRDDDEPSIYDPRPLVKSVFVSRPGMTMLQIDYSRAEVFLGAHYANAKNMLRMIHDHVDFHQATADEVGIPRSAAKRLNFSMQYGIGVKELASDLKISEKEARTIRAKYDRLHPEMRHLYSSMEKQARRYSSIRLFTGRVKHYSSTFPTYQKASSNLIQGGVAEMLRIATTNIYENLRQEGVHQLLHVHDSALMEVPDDKLDVLAPKIHDMFVDMSPYTFQVDFEADIKVGKRWSDLRPYKLGE